MTSEIKKEGSPLLSNGARLPPISTFIIFRK
nr:MAG TPA: hypothetical protein [Caudoviricetes sp.]